MQNRRYKADDGRIERRPFLSLNAQGRVWRLLWRHWCVRVLETGTAIPDLLLHASPVVWLL